jgi:hypothetical protein
LTNCAFNNEHIKQCSALNTMSCGKGCSFYKTKETLDAETECVYERLRSLPREEQEKISEMYFKFKKPWEKKGDIE